MSREQEVNKQSIRTALDCEHLAVELERSLEFVR